MLNPKSQISKRKGFGYWLFARCLSVQTLAQTGLLFAILCLVVGIFISGCAMIIEKTKGVVGISTKVLENGRKDAQTKTFNYDYNTCYLKVMEIIKKIDGYIYAKEKKKKMIAIYVSEQDTTPVGIFFEEVDKTNTKVLISSPSNYAKEIISGKIFLALEESQKARKVEVYLDAIEDKVDK